MSLQRKQELFLDGVEESFKYVRLTYARLIDTLRREARESANQQLNAALVIDSWTIIDLVKRLRTLLENTPGLKKTPELQVFLNKTDEIPEFRHHVQHIEEKAQEIATTGFPIWGSISWVRLVSLARKEAVIGTYIPGRLAKCEGVPVVNPSGREFHADVDHIELSINQKTVNLSELVRAVEQFSKSFVEAVSLAQKAGNRDENGLLRFEVRISNSGTKQRS